MNNFIETSNSIERSICNMALYQSMLDEHRIYSKLYNGLHKCLGRSKLSVSDKHLKSKKGGSVTTSLEEEMIESEKRNLATKGVEIVKKLERSLTLERSYEEMLEKESDELSLNRKLLKERDKELVKNNRSSEKVVNLRNSLAVHDAKYNAQCDRLNQLKLRRGFFIESFNEFFQERGFNSKQNYELEKIKGKIKKLSIEIKRELADEKRLSNSIFDLGLRKEKCIVELKKHQNVDGAFRGKNTSKIEKLNIEIKRLNTKIEENKIKLETTRNSRNAHEVDLKLSSLRLKPVADEFKVMKKAFYDLEKHVKKLDKQIAGVFGDSKKTQSKIEKELSQLKELEGNDRPKSHAKISGLFLENRVGVKLSESDNHVERTVSDQGVHEKVGGEVNQVNILATEKASTVVNVDSVSVLGDNKNIERGLA